MEDLTHVHPILKNLFFKLKIQKCVLAGRIKEVLPAWKLLTKDQELLALAGGYQIPLLMEPVQEKAPKILAAKASRSGSEGNAGKGFHFKSLSLKRGFFEQFVSDQQKRWRKPTSHKLEGSESIHSLQTLQDGRFALPGICVAKRGLHVQNIREECILQGSSIKTSLIYYRILR